MSRLAFVVAGLAGAATLAACEIRDTSEAGGAAKGPPPTAFPPMEKQQGADVTNDRVRLAAAQDGERMFMRRCGVCHLEGGMGTMVLARRLPPEQAKLQDRRDLQRELVVAAVREGIGSMPRLTRVDVTDPELDAIAAFLTRTTR
jgi:mono/diheme cytochrome c family protein